MFQKQAVMRKVFISLTPLLAFSIFLYGLKSIGIIVVTFILGIFTEWLFVRKAKKKISEAVLISCSLYALSMPPLVPLWIVGIGIVFGISFGKMVYGGFGRNIFNPAIVGRLFIYIYFPNTVNRWINPRSIDGFAGATPLVMLKNGELPPLLSLFTGLKSGSIGEGSIILILIAFIYLLYTKTANYKSSISTIVGFLVMQSILYFMNLGGANPIYSLFSGSILFIAVFMVTDPVSSPKKNNSLIVYGLLIGICTSLIRTYSLFSEGTSYAILLGNMFGPLFDETIGVEPQNSEIQKQFKSFFNLDLPTNKTMLARVDGEEILVSKFSGKAIWGTVNGIIAMDKDLKTIKGIDIISHNETPGLGGRIEEEWFLNQFKGETINGSNINVIQGSGDGNYDSADGIIDGIVGATRTSHSIEVMINQKIKSLREEVGNE